MRPDDPADGGSPGANRPGTRPVGSRSSGRLSAPSPRPSSDRSSRRSSGRREAGDEAAGTPPGHPEDPLGDPESVARAICLRLLTGQPRTRSELAAALARRGVPGEAAEAVLGRFAEVGLIDDRAFAAAWVGSRHAGRGLARRALAAELRRRGVDHATVGEAVAALDPATEESTATELVAHRLSATRRLEPAVRFRRLVGMLARKGYPPAVAARVVRAQLDEDGADGGEFDGRDGPDEPVPDEV